MIARDVPLSNIMKMMFMTHNDLTLILGAITLAFGGFVSGMGYVLIKQLSSKLAYYERREAFISDLVDRKMEGEDNE